MSWFAQIRFPMMFLPNVLTSMAEYKIAIERISSLFLAEELDTASEVGSDPGIAIKIENGNFAWNEAGVSEAEESVSNLRDISIEVPTGKLVAIIGSVGSGKSSLLQAIIGEMKRKSGKVSCNGTISFSAQKGWIQNASIKNNILFGLPEDRENYVCAVRDCCLERDLEILTDGDLVFLHHLL
jgi:ATP-binding cassette subfamily C (CFTR/MRP) protein 1